MCIIFASHIIILAEQSRLDTAALCEIVYVKEHARMQMQRCLAMHMSLHHSWPARHITYVVICVDVGASNYVRVCVLNRCGESLYSFGIKPVQMQICMYM